MKKVNNSFNFLGLQKKLKEKIIFTFLKKNLNSSREF